MKPKLILIGGGGHCKSCIDVIEHQGKFQIAGIVDVREKLNQKILGYKIIATDADLDSLARKYKNFLVTVGQIESAQKRVALYDKLKSISATLPSIISPLAYVSARSILGEGTIVMHHALINADAKIGNNCIINSKAIVEHDAIVYDHCHISTGAVVNGGVKVGAGTFVGSNATCREYITIGKNTTIGFAASVTKEIPPGSLIK